MECGIKKMKKLLNGRMVIAFEDKEHTKVFQEFVSVRQLLTF